MLSKVLVPDPIPRDAWDKAVGNWSAGNGRDSLLAFLLQEDVVGEPALLEALKTATGARLRQFPDSPADRGKPPQARLLEQHGFTYHGCCGGLHRVTGGAALPPRLEQLLGLESANWEWFLEHPLRTARRDHPGSDAVRPEDSGNGPASQWLDELLQGLVSRGATDVHFELAGEALTVRFHAGGEMERAGHWKGEGARTALQILRTRAGLAAAPPEQPLDGFFPIMGGPEQLKARLSLVKTIDGESAVLRVPARGVAVRSLRDLGLPGDLVDECRDCIQNNAGLILCCGPTGSGKTTTLYGLLHDLSGQDLKILTIEDPVEQELPHVVQCQVDGERSWDFPTAIRSFLRQDPDIIMVGEIRDAVSAAAACRAALSGHCVLGTLHARNEEAALHRLLAWGVSPGTVADAVRLVINQRMGKEAASGLLQPVFQWKTFSPEETYSFLRPKEGAASQSPADRYWPRSNPK